MGLESMIDTSAQFGREHQWDLKKGALTNEDEEK